MSVFNYSGDLGGVALYCLDAWEFWKHYTPCDEADEMLRTGRLYAYSEILRLITGRNISTEQDMVTTVILSMNPERRSHESEKR